MATGIISLLTALLGLLFWWLKRRAAAADDPNNQNKKRYEQIDEDIANSERRAGTDAPYHGQVNATADLDELERLQRAKSSGDQRGSK